MPLSLWGIVAGAIVSVVIGLLLSGGAGVALLILPLAIVACSIGALIGWVASRVHFR